MHGAGIKKYSNREISFPGRFDFGLTQRIFLQLSKISRLPICKSPTKTSEEIPKEKKSNNPEGLFKGNHARFVDISHWEPHELRLSHGIL